MQEIIKCKPVDSAEGKFDLVEQAKTARTSKNLDDSDTPPMTRSMQICRNTSTARNIWPHF
eukprot:1989737-Ditylum_brightwellii.AAC.1